MADALASEKADAPARPAADRAFLRISLEMWYLYTNLQEALQKQPPNNDGRFRGCAYIRI